MKKLNKNEKKQQRIKNRASERRNHSEEWFEEMRNHR